MCFIDWGSLCLCVLCVGGWKDVWLGGSAAEGLTAGQKERECAERTISDQLRNKQNCGNSGTGNSTYS